MGKCLLALDLGTTTGFRVGNAASSVSGTANFKPTRFESASMRYVKFRAWLSQMRAAYPDIDHVTFEEVRRHAGTDAAHIYGGLMAHLMVWCDDAGLDYDAVPVGTIKKHWTGKGNANKDAMIAESVRRGLSPVDDNEADAQALFDFKMSETSRSSAPAEMVF